MTEKFKYEVLSYGNIYFYDGEKIFFIKCLNKKNSKPENYKCFQLESKNIFIFIIIYYY